MNLDDMTKAELAAYGEEIGVTFPKGATKAEMIAALKTVVADAEADAAAEQPAPPPEEPEPEPEPEPAEPRMIVLVSGPTSDGVDVFINGRHRRFSFLAPALSTPAHRARLDDAGYTYRFV